MGRTLLLLIAVLAVHQADAQVTEVRNSCADIAKTVEPVDYAVQQKVVGKTEPSTAALFISVSPTATERPEFLLSVACSIRKRYSFSDSVDVDAYIFDDSRSAKNIVLGLTDQEHYTTYLLHLVARYVSQRSRSVELLEYVSPELQNGLPVLIRARVVMSP